MAGVCPTVLRFSSYCRPKTCSTRTSSEAFFIPLISNLVRRQSEFSRRSSACSLPGSCSTAYRRSGFLPKASLRYRRQILALKHYFAGHNTTVLLLDDLTTDTLDKTVHSVAHAVVRLEELSLNYGAEPRRLRVLKYRGQRFRGGYHDFVIETGGVRVFPASFRPSTRRVSADRALNRNPGVEHLARRRDRTGVEHADLGTVRHGKDNSRNHLCRRRG